jgi:purine-binding chemotaxis protein CheW
MNTLLFSFRVGGYLFGAPASSVVELSREVEVFRVPGSPPFVKGLINLRGQLAVAID